MPEPSFAIESIPTSLSQLENSPLLAGILRGVEKESLRIQPDGALARTDHPKSLGAALTHPQITTDFSEALLEFITPPSHLLSQLFAQLTALHTFSYENLGEELLWVNSMPCQLRGDEAIPVARYGSGYRGQMKTIYRVGLGHRYGRVMQTVAGLHYNFSLPRAFWAYLHQLEHSDLELADYINERYFDLIRNFRRHYWILLYLFGASPAVSDSFVEGRPHDLVGMAHHPGTLYLPNATTLRMGDLGYQSSAQESLFVCYNSLNSYVSTLGSAIFTPYPEYCAMGELDASGARQQLNTGLLQIENEFYSAIRPKRTAEAGETALTALCQRGVEYIEVRCLDLDPFSPVGVSENQIRFLDTFLLYCLFKQSPSCDLQEFRRIGRNHKRVVKEGRNPETVLELPEGGEKALGAWADEVLQALEPLAQLMDQVHRNGGQYTAALSEQHAKVKDPRLTPSARVLAELTARELSYTRWGLEQAQAHQRHLLAKPLAGSQRERLQKLATSSLRQQLQEDALNEGSFEEYLKAYYSQYQMCCRQIEKDCMG